jgi:hypothetical protein
VAVVVSVVPGGLSLGCRLCNVGARIPTQEPVVFESLNDFLAQHRPCQRTA